MARKYSPDPVTRFVEAAQQSHLPPATKARVLWGIAHSMTEEEREEARAALFERYDKRRKFLKEIDAPKSLIERQEALLTPVNVAVRALDRASGVESSPNSYYAEELQKRGVDPEGTTIKEKRSLIDLADQLRKEYNDCTTE